MNTRLENEIEAWFYNKHYVVDAFDSFEECAKHFYNLALEDVRKHLKPEMDISYCDGYERGCIDGRNGLREDLINFIDNLTK